MVADVRNEIAGLRASRRSFWSRTLAKCYEHLRAAF
jgi:hypothetical protein